MATPLTIEAIKAIDSHLTTDLSHWADYGITTVEGLADYLDMECAQNVFKSEHGFRPRHITTPHEARMYLEQVEKNRDMDEYLELVNSYTTEWP